MKISTILNVVLALALVILCFIMIKGNRTESKSTEQADTVRSEVLAPFDVQKEFKENGFSLYTQALVVCSGDSTENNAMTISSGFIGNFLGNDVPAVQVNIAPARYTHQFMEKYPRFTLMKFDDPKISEYLGSHSGRDGDKAKALGLHVAYTEHGTPYYEEASLVLECEIATSWQVDPAKFRNDTPSKWYEGFTAGYHTVYIGQVISGLKR